jgi:hypothetical protein
VKNELFEKKRAGRYVVLPRSVVAYIQCVVANFFSRIASLYILGNAGCYGCHLLGRQCELLTEKVHVTLGCDGDKVYVCMRYFQSHYRNAYTLAFDSFFEAMRYLAGKCHKIGVGFVIEIKDIIYFLFGYNQCVTFGYGADVEKCKETVILGYFVTGYLSGYNATEY